MTKRTRTMSRAPVGLPLVLLLAACSGSSDVAERVEATIGPAGGTLAHPSGASLVIPAGALVEDTRISIERATPTSGAPLPADAVGASFRLLPHGLAFSTPAILTLPVAPAGHEVTLFTLSDDVASVWEEVTGGTVDADGGHVAIAHLSYYQFGVCSVGATTVCWLCDSLAACGFAPDAGVPVDAGPVDIGPPSCAPNCETPAECLYTTSTGWSCLVPCVTADECPTFVPACVSESSVTVGGYSCTEGACVGVQAIVDCTDDQGNSTACTDGVCSSS